MNERPLAGQVNRAAVAGGRASASPHILDMTIQRTDTLPGGNWKEMGNRGALFPFRRKRSSYPGTFPGILLLGGHCRQPPTFPSASLPGRLSTGAPVPRSEQESFFSRSDKLRPLTCSDPATSCRLSFPIRACSGRCFRSITRPAAPRVRAIAGLPRNWKQSIHQANRRHRDRGICIHRGSITELEASPVWQKLNNLHFNPGAASRPGPLLLAADQNSANPTQTSATIEFVLHLARQTLKPAPQGGGIPQPF